MRPLLLNNIRLAEPGGAPRPASLLFAERKIAAIDPDSTPDDAETIDGKGQFLLPGLIDAGIFRADAQAALAGGITRVVLMPDQSPPLDDPALIERAQRIGKPHVWVHPMAAATRSLQGTELAELGLMQEAGAVAAATGRGAIADTGTMYRLLQYAAGFDLLVVTHAEDPALAPAGSATLGDTAARLGLPSAPAIAEAVAVARDVRLAEAVGARLHIRTVSTAESIEIVARAKDRGVRVTCGTTPAHLAAMAKAMPRQ